MLSIALVGLLYIVLLATYLQPLNGFWSSDQGTKLIQTQSLLLNRFSTNALIYPGEIYDPEHRFTPLRGTYYEHEGQTFSIWSPAFAALSSVPFFFFGYGGLYVVPVGATLMLLALCAVLARSIIGSPWDVVSVLVLGLASPLAFYSLVFWEFSLAALLLTAAATCVVVALHPQRERLLIPAGVFVSLTIWLRVEAILALGALGFGLLLTRPRSIVRDGVLLGLGATPGVVIWLAFNRWVYGFALGPHVLVSGAATSAVQETRVQWIDVLLMPLVGLLPLAVAMLAALALVTRLYPRTRHWATLSVALGLLLLVSALAWNRLGNWLQTSLVITFPMILLLFLPTPEQGTYKPEDAGVIWRQKAARFLACFALGYVMLGLAAKIPSGGDYWGPRVLLPILPALALAAMHRTMHMLHATSVKWRRAATALTALVLLIVSLYSEGWGLRRIAAFNAANHHVVTTVAQSNERVVITDVWYAPCVIAPLFYDGHLIYLLSSGPELDALVEQLQANGVEGFYYLGTQSDAIRAASQVGPQLEQISNEAVLAHNLLGAVYQINPR